MAVDVDKEVLFTVRDELCLEAEDVTLDSDLAALGADSLDVLNMVHLLEGTFNIDLPNGKSLTGLTPRVLADEVRKALATRGVQVSPRPAVPVGRRSARKC